MTPFGRARSATRLKHASLSRLVALPPPGQRHLLPYIRGVILFTRLSPALLLDEVRHQVGKLQEISHAEHTAALADDDLGIECDGVAEHAG